ncbi:tudor domain-containing protein 6 [Python bivittatus]|uniref:Tudor domain-containing protein 6 n=1 Tax=Python bivittatus TaxID=176946 RepID=A0A9F5IVJ8_PYTBI|nr:tudor domain-containing protein 6 [Python bivittatus]
MCSALPSPGSSVTLRVSFVEVHPEVPLVRLWGLPVERREEYLRLTEDIQVKVGPRLAKTSGNGGGRGDGGGHALALALGDLCLVELGGRWHRRRFVSRRPKLGQNYRVFLLDEGRTVTAGSYYLARGRSELFHLPSEVMGCILADLLPPGGIGASSTAAPWGSKSLIPLGSQILNLSWAADAIEFLGVLHGKEVSGLIREVLIPQRLVVLEVPWLLTQMCHLGLASHVASSAFCTLLSTTLGVTGIASVPLEPTSTLSQSPIFTAAAQSQQGHVTMDFFYPQLELNVTEPVVVTQISDPHRIYCQLRSLSKEIQLLSDAMYRDFEASKGKYVEESLPTPGYPCAARGIDGCWYRALLLEIYPAGDLEDQPGAVAQVICVDYGRKEFVTKRNLHNLPAEYFRMPVVTYPCSLQGITDGGCGWAHSQISQLKTLLLGKVVQAHIEAYCPFEHLYYVTLYGEDGLNLNCLYGVQAHCLAQSLLHSNQEYTSDLMIESESLGVSAQKELGSLSEALSAIAAVPFSVVRLKAGEYHNVQVSFLQDPSAFWVHLQEHQQPLCHLKWNLSDFYSQSKKLEGILLEPKVGSLCCVMLKENSYHRALVTKVQGKGIVVYLVDRGNTEIVDLYKVKELLPQFRELPAVAVRCALANPFTGRSWNPEAIDYFRKSVLNKELMIKVLGMQGDAYIVELFDNSLMGEKNLGKIMSQRKYTKHHEVLETLQTISNRLLAGDCEGKPKGLRPVKITSTTDEVEYPQKHDSTSSYTVEVLKTKHHSSEGAFYSASTLGGRENLSCEMQNYSEIKAGEGQLEFGSTVDVIVTHIENPSHFWCQLFKNSHELRILMAKIQDYCIHSAEPHDWPNPVCLAKCSEDKKWYRALIINKVHYAEEVEVAYVDYGYKEHVSLKNVRATKAEFLTLKAQAFRCSLYNLIQPKNPNPFVWDKKATEAFHEFVDSASKLELKCTIFASAALNSTDLFNIVDLITPFESVCHFLIRKGLATFVQTEKPLITSVHLLSYYYSMHNIKIGSEEVVYVTHVNSPCLFFCQLARNANALEKLTSNISKLSKMWHSLQTSHTCRNLYLAKYIDECWYRAVVTSKNDTKEVFFVDFGNTQLLKNEDLIVVPNDAYELMLLPMQAIKCSLSDTVDPSKDAVEWFEQAVLDKPLKALIVAKDPDGKLLIELYDGKMQINAKLKQSLGLQASKEITRYTENRTLSSRYSLSREENSEKELALVDFVKPVFESKTKYSAVFGEACQLQQKTKSQVARKFLGLTERFSKSNSVADRKDRQCVALLKKRERCDIRNQSESITYSSHKNICELPQKNIKAGLKSLVYVSHINNLSDFYVQLVEDESFLDSISEKINSSKTVSSLAGQQLHVGDLICAIFLEDGLWYRAVIIKESTSELVEVCYIDYGNTAVVSIHKTCRLVEDCSSFPVMSIHCTLGSINSAEISEWTQEAMLYFSQMTSEIQMNSQFVEKVEGKWEIILSDEKGDIIVDMINSCLAHQKSLLIETADKGEDKTGNVNLCEDTLSDMHSRLSVSQSFLWKTPKVGQTAKAFSLVPKSPEYFWCQFVENDISSIQRKLQEAGEHARIHVDDLKNGCPCLAKSSEDDLFHRAVVSHIEGSSLTVTDIDHGTEKLVSIEVIRQIPDELLILPPQAFLCCLFGFNSEKGSWAEGINKIFYDMIADLPLEITVMDKLNHGSFEIPLFVVKLECQKISINEQIKHFWKHNDENGNSTMANTYNLEEQIGNAEEENSKSLLFETETSVCTVMAPKDTSILEDVCCCPNLLESVDKSFGMRDSVLSETFPSQPSKYQLKHHFITHEVFDTESQQTTFDTLNNETNYSGKGKNVADSMGLSEIQVSTCKIEVLEYNPLESQGGAEDKEIILDNPEVQLPLDDTKSLSDFVPFEVLPPLNNAKNMPDTLETLKMPSFEDTLEPETMEIKTYYNEPQGRSELCLLESQHMEGQSAHKVEENTSLTKDNENLILEVMAPEVFPLLTDKASDNTPFLQQSTLSIPADNKIQSSFSETKVKPQEFYSTERLVEECKLEKKDKNPNVTDEQTLLGKNYGETQRTMHESFKETIFVEKDSLTNIQLDEVRVESLIHDTEKKENICNLMGFDIGSECMVWSGIQWYKAEILGISAEGTKVLNLSNGNEEIVNPIHVWNGIPELDSNLTQIMSKNKMDTLHSVPATFLAVEVEEVTLDSDDTTTLLSCDSTESTAERC